MLVNLPSVSLQELLLRDNEETSGASQVSPDPSLNSILPPSGKRTRRVVNSIMTPRLLTFLFQHSPVTISSMAAALGVAPQSLRQYLTGRRPKPSLEWFVRFVEKCGG